MLIGSIVKNKGILLVVFWQTYTSKKKKKNHKAKVKKLAINIINDLFIYIYQRN